MAELVYVLCAVTCLICTLLLGRGYLRSRQRLLAWSTVCFAGLFVSNVVTVVDLAVVRDYDLRWLRGIVGSASVAVMAIGLIWERP